VEDGVRAIGVVTVGAVVACAAAGCIRWNAQSRTVSGEEFLRVPEQYRFDEDQPGGAGHPPALPRPKGYRFYEDQPGGAGWCYGGADSKYHYLEHWGWVAASWPEYLHSIRAPKSELRDWCPPKRGTFVVPAQ